MVMCGVVEIGVEGLWGRTAFRGVLHLELSF